MFISAQFSSLKQENRSHAHVYSTYTKCISYLCCISYYFYDTCGFQQIYITICLVTARGINNYKLSFFSVRHSTLIMPTVYALYTLLYNHYVISIQLDVLTARCGNASKICVPGKNYRQMCLPGKKNTRYRDIDMHSPNLSVQAPVVSRCTPLIEPLSDLCRSKGRAWTARRHR